MAKLPCLVHVQVINAGTDGGRQPSWCLGHSPSHAAGIPRSAVPLLCPPFCSHLPHFLGYLPNPAATQPHSTTGGGCQRQWAVEEEGGAGTTGTKEEEEGTVAGKE